MKGIDISEYNGVFDAKSAISQGAEFVIIRCGYGSDYTNQDDKQFAANVARCEAAGLPYGLYLYAYATTTAMAQSEAAHALRLANTCNPTWGIWYDVEDKKMDVGTSSLANVCNTFCNAVKAAGYYTGIYANASWLKNKLTDASLKQWPKWVAHFTTAAAPGYNNDDVVLWQYECPPGDAATPTAYDWNRTMKDFFETGGNTLSRVLKTGRNQITNPYKSGSHDGIDLVKKTNELDTIVAHSSGTVVLVQTGYGNAPGSTGNASYGNLVKIRHPNGYFTLYAHLASVAVKTGDTVAKGRTIGYMGNSGDSYGAHLHFEVRNASDSRIDPTPYINADLPGLNTTDNKEEIDMTKEEVQAMIQTEATRIANEQIAAYFSAMAGTKCPAWAKGYMEEAIKRGMVSGDGKTAATPDNVRPESYLKRDEAVKLILEAEKSK